ncbi:MAG: hypothetical protein H6815_07930 [Phycisphaeraceae bacterium]|nr:hypothetical protein [Phycisphaerales bacterium]MCB9860370.1 hypothetical protein [Phycisphaeraceae bacterium]
MGTLDPAPTWEIGVSWLGTYKDVGSTQVPQAFKDGIKDPDIRFAPTDPRQRVHHVYSMLRGNLALVRDDWEPDSKYTLHRFTGGQWRHLDMSALHAPGAFLTHASSNELLVFRDNTDALSLWAWHDNDVPERIDSLGGLTAISSSGQGTWIGLLNGQFVFGELNDQGQLAADNALVLEQQFSTMDTVESATWLDRHTVLLNRTKIVLRDGATIPLVGTLPDWSDQSDCAMRRAFIVNDNAGNQKLVYWRSDQILATVPVDKNVIAVSPGGTVLVVSREIWTPINRFLPGRPFATVYVSLDRNAASKFRELERPPPSWAVVWKQSS